MFAWLLLGGDKDSCWYDTIPISAGGHIRDQSWPVRTILVGSDFSHH